MLIYLLYLYLCIKLCIQARTPLTNMFGKFIFPWTCGEPGKLTNQLRWWLRENCWRDRKIFPRTWKRTKMQTNTVPPLCSSKKLTGDGLQQTVRELSTNYTNKMFASVYAALKRTIQVPVLNWFDFHEILVVGAGPLIGEPYCFWKQSVQ